MVSRWMVKPFTERRSKVRVEIDSRGRGEQGDDGEFASAIPGMR